MKQLIRLKMGRRISLAATALIAAGALGTSGAASAGLAGTVTSVKGDASVGEQPAEISNPVSEGESIVTGPDAACSVLVDERALIQFCGQTAVRLRHDEQRNATVVDVTEGSTRTLAGPRLADEPLEIHTPVAIAAILGTILSVEVDPVTRDATFALEEGRARIQTVGPAAGRSITLDAGEQITVHADGKADPVEPLRLRDAEGQLDCFDDHFFHGASVEVARAERAQAVTDAVTRADIPYAGLPPVAAPPESPPELPGKERRDRIHDDPCGLSSICTGDFFPEPEPPRTTPPRTPARGGQGHVHHGDDDDYGP
jgi:hypothetical protein